MDNSQNGAAACQELPAEWTVYDAFAPRLPIRNRIALMFSDAWKGRELAWRLFTRDLSAQYRSSFLGILWAFVPPLLLASCFIFAGKAAIMNLTSSSLPYPVFVVVGIVLWQTFADAVQAPSMAVGGARAILAKVRFPYEALVLAKLGEVAFNVAIRLILVAVILAVYRVSISWSVLLAPFAIVVLIGLGAGLGLFLAPLTGLYGDIARGLTALLAIWFLLTPVAYEHAKPGSLVDWINFLNPVTPLLTTARELLTTGILTRPTGFVLIALATLPIVLLGWMFYRFALAFTIERAGA